MTQKLVNSKIGGLFTTVALRPLPQVTLTNRVSHPAMAGYDHKRMSRAMVVTQARAQWADGGRK